MNFTLLWRTCLTYLIVFIAGAVLVPPCLIIACLPAKYRYDNRLFFLLLDYFYKIVVYAPLTPVHITGEEHLPKDAAIFVANHQSSFDIPALGSLCNGVSHVWLVLAYYVSTPVLGFFITRMFVPVDKKQSGSSARSLIQLYRFVEGKQRHLLIFPEGGRFIDGTIHPFYEGFAMIAKKTGRPVIPVYMPNNGKLYPPFSFYVYPVDVVIHIGAPFYFQETDTEAEFTQRVRQWFIEQSA